jgi:hypothetical protein
MEYSPFSFTGIANAGPSPLVSTTSASATTAPVGSVTFPLMEAFSPVDVVDCSCPAQSDHAISANINTLMTREKK